MFGGWQPSASSIFLIAGFAETNRLPFDLPEAESELVAGYHTEYSAMKFALFFMAEYIDMATVVGARRDALPRRLARFGFVPRGAASTGWLAVDRCRSSAFLPEGRRSSMFLFVWVRWTLPRFRYDQLMELGWKMLLPLALAERRR